MPNCSISCEHKPYPIPPFPPHPSLPSPPVAPYPPQLPCSPPLSPMPSTCSSTLKTSTCAFSISSNNTTEYGRRLTASVSRPPCMHAYHHQGTKEAQEASYRGARRPSIAQRLHASKSPSCSPHSGPNPSIPPPSPAAPTSSYPTYPGGAPSSRDTACFSMYSLMSCGGGGEGRGGEGRGGGCSWGRMEERRREGRRKKGK